MPGASGRSSAKPRRSGLRDAVDQLTNIAGRASACPVPVGERPPKCPGEAGVTPRETGTPRQAQDARHASSPVRVRVRGHEPHEPRRAMTNRPGPSSPSCTKRRHRRPDDRGSSGRPGQARRGARRTVATPPRRRQSARHGARPKTPKVTKARKAPTGALDEADPDYGRLQNGSTEPAVMAPTARPAAAAFGVPETTSRNYVTKCGNGLLDANGPATNEPIARAPFDPDKARRCRRHRLADPGRRAHPRRRRLRRTRPGRRRRPRQSSSASTTPSPRWRTHREPYPTLTADGGRCWNATAPPGSCGTTPPNWWPLPPRARRAAVRVEVAAASMRIHAG